MSEAKLDLILNDMLLARTQLPLQTAVQKFAKEVEKNRHSAPIRTYSSLIPLQQPRAGEQYRFEVDLDLCTGCKSCVTACHSLNGLDHDESWRRVGTLTSEDEGFPAFLQPLTSACHHCAEPACMYGCPVGAYEKNALTGIVRHLDDQCIGCQYCRFTCPYEVPRYNKRLGIVRKCDMCSQRLSVGEAPACAQACPTEAIRIGTVAVQDLYENPDSGFTGSPIDSSHTKPSTLYHSRKALPPHTVSGPVLSLQTEDAHSPLVLMLVLTQLAVGAFAVHFLLQLFWDHYADSASYRWFPGVLTAISGVGLGAASLHLGRPFQAYRAILGIKRSWMSREILIFALFSGAAMTLALSQLPPLAGLIAWSSTLVRGLELSVIGLGLLGVYCSIMIYAVTPRICWNFMRCSRLFFGSTLLLGSAFCLLWWVGVSVFESPHRGLGWEYKMLSISVGTLVLLKILNEALFLRHFWDRSAGELYRSARLRLENLKRETLLRFTCGLTASCMFIGLGVYQPLELRTGMGLVFVLAFTLLLLGELVERLHFFRAVSFPRMPGSMP